MITKGIRGAITVEENSALAIQKATIELLKEMINKNNINQKLISHVIFSMTSDLNAEFPAKYARLNLHWNDVPMLCFTEINVPNSLPKCIRVLIVINCDENFQPEFVYLKEAKGLRK